MQKRSILLCLQLIHTSRRPSATKVILTTLQNRGRSVREKEHMTYTYRLEYFGSNWDQPAGCVDNGVSVEHNDICLRINRSIESFDQQLLILVDVRTTQRIDRYHTSLHFFARLANE